MPRAEGRRATTRFVDPTDLRHDMQVSIATCEPGAHTPFAKTHVMEHGLFVPEGETVHRLDKDRVEIEASAFLWLRAC